MIAQIVDRFLRNRLAVFGFIIVVAVILNALFAPLIAPYNPTKQNYNALLEPPSSSHLMGTDPLGRDIFSRVVFGARYALLIGVAVVTIEAGIGLLLGLIGGFYGGLVDAMIMRLVDAILSIPVIILALAIAGALGGGLINMIIAIGIAGWSRFARLVRGSVLSVKEQPYIEAARSLGANDPEIIFRHILPNLIGPIIVYSSLYVPTAILWSAALSFLGMGAQPPTPEWGAIIADGRDYLSMAWWIATFPGVALMFTVLGFNFLGDGLRDALDPKAAKKV